MWPKITRRNIHMERSILDRNLKSEIDFSKSIIDNIFKNKTEDPVPSATALTEDDVKEIESMSEAVAQISGIRTLEANSNKLVQESINLLGKKKINEKHLKLAEHAISRIKKYESFLLKFCKKYR